MNNFLYRLDLPFTAELLPDGHVLVAIETPLGERLVDVWNANGGGCYAEFDVKGFHTDGRNKTTETYACEPGEPDRQFDLTDKTDAEIFAFVVEAAETLGLEA